MFAGWFLWGWTYIWTWRISNILDWLVLFFFFISRFVSRISWLWGLILFVFLLNPLNLFLFLCDLHCFQIVTLFILFEISSCSILWRILASISLFSPWLKSFDRVRILIWGKFLKFTTWNLRVYLLKFFNYWFLKAFIYRILSFLNFLNLLISCDRHILWSWLCWEVWMSSDVHWFYRLASPISYTELLLSKRPFLPLLLCSHTWSICWLLRYS